MLSRRPPVPVEAPDFVRNVLGPMIVGDGDDLPVSALPCDGTYPSGTAKWEKRNIAQEMPVWDTGSLHPMRQVCDGLPTRCYPHESL